MVLFRLLLNSVYKQFSHDTDTDFVRSFIKSWLYYLYLIIIYNFEDGFI